MEHDDDQIGRVLTRREVIALFGIAGISLMGKGTLGGTRPVHGAMLPACIVRPQQMEGPYFVDEKLNRSDIRSDPADGVVKEGIPLDLTFQISRMSGSACTPLQGVMVDVWQCDAAGIYSDVRDTNELFNTVGKKFLRGYQVTDASGAARFTTIYPGWYQGRTVHIHFKLRTAPVSGRSHEFTSQLYFDDALSDRILGRAPYIGRGQRVRNAQDGIFRSGGDQLMLALKENARRYGGTFDVGLQIT